MADPLIVLHVCMGNICRSPMAERLLAAAVRAHGAADAVHSESAGTGGWHAGEPMNPPAAAELRRRGVDPAGFRARKMTGAHIDTADLVLTATAEQIEYVLELRPDAAAKTFLLGGFGRLLAEGGTERAAGHGWPAMAVPARGLALVAAADEVRADAAPLLADELDDPWGRGPAVFTATADRIEASLQPFVDALFR